jgi:hypothetical protein
MIAFFLTMPISRNDADDRDHAQVAARQQQRQQRPHRRPRQGREDGDRVDVALVEHAEHDVHGDHRRQDQQQVLDSEAWKARAAPWNWVCSADRHASAFFRRLVDQLHPSPSATPGARLNDIVTAGN